MYILLLASVCGGRGGGGRREAFAFVVISAHGFGLLNYKYVVYLALFLLIP